MAPLSAARPVQVEKDPVCGMSVDLTAAESAEVGGIRYYFCCAGCRRRFESNPSHYVEVSTG